MSGASASTYGLEAEWLRSMSGREWPNVVADIWEANRSRFATPFHDLPHHDQVSIYRLLTRAEATK